VYGYGKSEEFLGEFMKAGLSDVQPIIAAEFVPLKRHLPVLLLLLSHCMCNL
jgi:aryl-alcohol dehydrogenase-like predicted oxidoreductase